MTDTNKKEDTDKRINFHLFRNNLPSWEDIFTFQDSYIENLFSIARKSIALPDEDFQLKLFLTYALIPSGLANVVPYLQLYGVSGSGKSTLGFLASVIRNTEIYTSTSTFASIRNHLTNKKFDGGYENNIILIWDDIDPDLFSEQPDLYRMFKVGYTRQTDKMTVASSSGKNITFRVFCPKIFSSIHPFYADNNFNELLRRLMVVTTKKAILLDKTELLDLTAFNWNGFYHYYDSFWQDEISCELYSQNRKELTKKKPSFIAPERWQISIDLLATGRTFQIFNDRTEAINFIDKYWQSHDEKSKKSKGALYELLEELISEEIKTALELNTLGIRSNLTIRPQTIKRAIDRWQYEGQLETSVNPKLLAKTMGLLGFRLSATGWVKIDT